MSRARPRLRGAVLVLRAQVLQHLGPQVRVAAARRVAQAHARLYQRRMVPRRHVHLPAGHAAQSLAVTLDVCVGGLGMAQTSSAGVALSLHGRRASQGLSAKTGDTSPQAHACHMRSASFTQVKACLSSHPAVGLHKGSLKESGKSQSAPQLQACSCEAYATSKGCCSPPKRVN